VLPPAATQLLPSVQDLGAPNSLALPTKPEQVQIRELRPIGLLEAENLAEVNNPNLKLIATQVDQAQSNLRAQIALWYPTLSINANALPSYTGGQQFSSSANPATPGGQTSTNRWFYGAQVQAQWALINPQRVPAIAAARDSFEKAKDQYLIALRELRLQVDVGYFTLQQSDDSVRIGQESVRASVVSLRDARARYQAGVATKLEVLEAETQLARDQQLLTESLAAQAVARRTLASLLDLPQNVTPTAKDPARIVGAWQPSLQESIIAAYAFREELDQALLDISIANSNANQALGAAIAAADLVIPDGAGVVWALRRQGVRVRRTPGIELARALLSYAEAHDWSVALIGAAPEVMEQLTRRLLEELPSLRLVLAEHGYQAAEAWPQLEQRLLSLKPDLVLVALGVPRQETWTQRLHAGQPGIWMGVGGSFDVWAGVKQRAPEWMSRLQVEWAYRLIQEPSRWRRMLSLPAFAWQVLRRGERRR